MYIVILYCVYNIVVLYCVINIILSYYVVFLLYFQPLLSNETLMTIHQASGTESERSVPWVVQQVELNLT